MEKSSI